MALAMKTILIPVERNDLIESSLSTACLLAKAFGSYVEGFALSPELNTMMATEGIGSIVIYPTEVTVQDKTSAAESRLLFENAMRANGIAPAGTASASPSFGWNDKPLAGDAFLGSYGRAFDLTVVGRPGPAATSPHMGTLEAALFDSGRPILVAPPAAPEKLGEVVTIAWNGSTETARAIAFAMPILKRARKVAVLQIEGTGVPGPTAADMARYIERHEVHCETIVAQHDKRSTGAAMLEEAAKFGSDLLVKGAYTQSRLRQMIFGGATSHIIAEAMIPVLLAH